MLTNILTITMIDIMKNNSIRKRLSIALIVVIVFITLGQALEKYCPVRYGIQSINSTINIQGLYPWPGAKIPFACHIRDFVKSPFAPKYIDSYEVVYKEDGFRVLEDFQRSGVVSVRIFPANEFLPIFAPSHTGKMPLLADSITIYIDEQKLNIGHVGWRELDVQFSFVTILDPFLLPGKHIGKIVLLLPSGETTEYEWNFEITWW